MPSKASHLLAVVSCPAYKEVVNLLTSFHTGKLNYLIYVPIYLKLANQLLRTGPLAISL